MGFKELCPSVPQNLLQVAKCSDFYQVKIQHASVHKHFDDGWEKTYVAVGHPGTSH